MKIQFDENNLNLFDDGEELYEAFLALFVHKAEEHEIDKSIVDELIYLHESFIDLKKSFVYSIIENAILHAKD